MTDPPSPPDTTMASVAAAQIAIQTMLSLLINLYISEADDPDHARDEITGMAEEMVDKAFIPDLSPAEQSPARVEAKQLLRQIIGGYQSN